MTEKTSQMFLTSGYTAGQYYQASLFTQLVVKGLAPNQAMNIATEATNRLTVDKLPFPNILVG